MKAKKIYLGRKLAEEPSNDYFLSSDGNNYFVVKKSKINGNYKVLNAKRSFNILNLNQAPVGHPAFLKLKQFPKFKAAKGIGFNPLELITDILGSHSIFKTE